MIFILLFLFACEVLSLTKYQLTEKNQEFCDSDHAMYPCIVTLELLYNELFFDKK